MPTRTALLALLVPATLLPNTRPLPGVDSFVTRSRDTLLLHGRPFAFTGTNAYYLMTLAARGDTLAVLELFRTARNLGMKAVRTWAFSDGPDSLNIATLQFAPGRYNETTFRALDFVVEAAGRFDVRLMLSLVNNWDDFGGMNQYVRWRAGTGDHHPESRPPTIQKASVNGAMGRRYNISVAANLEHDDFYSDPTIRMWYRNHVERVTGRVNTRTGVAYKDDPAIMLWELANEARSSDRSGSVILSWMSEMSAFLRQMAPRQLVGTGEEGFDTSPHGYSSFAYDNGSWLFDGTAGTSFASNTSLPAVDVAGVHLYSSGWGLQPGSGSTWIADHARIAGALGKPLILGEFGALQPRALVFDAWLDAAVAEGLAGAAVWQIVVPPVADPTGYAILCPAYECDLLSRASAAFEARINAPKPDPATTLAHRIYPNPTRGESVVAYDLRFDAFVTIRVFNSVGQQVAEVSEVPRSAGQRREILRLPVGSGVYFYSILARSSNVPDLPAMFGTGRTILLH